MPNRTIELTPELDQFIANRLADGLYDDASEIVRDALYSLERDEDQYQAKLAALRAAIDAGDASGLAEGTTDEIFAQIHQELGIDETTH